MDNVSDIYAQTGVLFTLSLWYESFGRVAAEAVMNGIPVLASKTGGLPEAVGEGGILLAPPASCTGGPERWNFLPSEEECRSWANALYSLWDRRVEMGNEVRKAGEAHSLERSGDRLLSILEPLLAKRAGDADFSRRSSVIYPDDPKDWSAEACRMPLVGQG